MSDRLSCAESRPRGRVAREAAGAEWALSREGTGRAVIAGAAGRRACSTASRARRGRRGRGRARRPALAAQRGGAAQAPAVAAAVPARHPHLGRPRRPPRPRDAGPRAGRARGRRPAIAPIFPQQSIREMTRTGRTPIEVMDDATWGQFAEGWRDGTGADADHLKTTGRHRRLPRGRLLAVHDRPGRARRLRPPTRPTSPRCGRAPGRCPGATLEDAEARCASATSGQSFAVEHLKIAFDEATLLRAAVKYGARRGARRADVAPPAEGGGHAAGRARGLGRRDGDADLAGGALLGGRRAEAARRRLGEPRAALRRPLREGRRLHRRPRRAREGRRRPRGARAPLRPLQAEPALGLRQVQRLPDRGAPRERASSTSRPRARATSRRCAPSPRVDPAFFRDDLRLRPRALRHRQGELPRLGRARRARPEAKDVPRGGAAGPARAVRRARDPARDLRLGAEGDGAPTGGSRFKDTLFGLLRSNPEAYADNLERHFVRHLQPFVPTTGRGVRAHGTLGIGAMEPDSAVAAVDEPATCRGRGARPSPARASPRLPLDGRRVLVLIPDGTRTMPMPLLFDVLDEARGAARRGARLPGRARHPRSR